MGVKPESYFPNDYRGARKAFIAACTARGLDAVTRVHPTAKGPDGKPLFLDVCAAGPRDAKKAVLLISATHGIEGYFGSGVQTGLLREGITPPDGARLVMLHALNPFGFAHHRRVNEDNVDINRNFVDHAAPPANPGYDALADAIALKDISDKSFAQAESVMAAYRARHGDAAWQQAVSAGQYNHPGGLFYGGTAPCWSAQALQSVLTEDLSRVTQLVVMDFHTGLGPSGAGEMIVESAPASAAFARAQAIWGDLVVSDADGQSVSAPLTGTVECGLAAMLPGVELTLATLEVGTLPLDATFRALVAANWQDHFAPHTDRQDEINRLMREAFYTDTPRWKRSVWDLGQRTVIQALQALE